ncbi:uncharacterized protein [Littorina saxatilis]|uniref:uncharacterized protein n=1 Tax=Littorina saxatilis TaxID=31220 RepID=UPI0038B4395B
MCTCRKVLVILSLPLFLLHLFWTPGVRGNHNKWWTCNDACARCARRVMPMEEMITQLYPGLFSTVPPANAVPLPEFIGGIDLPVNASRGNYSVDSGSATMPGAGAPNRGSVSGVKGSAVFVDSISNRPIFHNENPVISSEPTPGGFGCCETVMEYGTPPNVTIAGKVYKVVHLRHMFQFIPIGRCKPGSTCGAGQCVDQFRAHWVLVYNSTRPVQGAAPVSFAPIEVPSHCECLNVGHP